MKATSLLNVGILVEVNSLPFHPTVVKRNHKHKWEEAEVNAVERHMMQLIKRLKVPQKIDCIRCLEAEREVLRDRSWKGVKDYVRNRITTLKCTKKSAAQDSKGLPSPQKHQPTQQHMNLDENEASDSDGKKFSFLMCLKPKWIEKLYVVKWKGPDTPS